MQTISSSTIQIDSERLNEEERFNPVQVKTLPKILFLSDSYLEEVCWGTFYLSIIRNLAAVSDNLLAVRTNSYFHGASTKPLSAEHLSIVSNAITRFKPDIIFSINHSGLTNETLQVIPENAKIITLFIDFYGRCPEELRSFSKRDFIWSTGLGAIQKNFISEYKDILHEDQLAFTLWGADTSVFRPLALKRDIDISFVGSAFNTRPLSDLISSLSPSPKNRQILIDLYFDHRKKYVFDLVKELTLRKFDFSQADDKLLRTLTTNSKLQNIFADQISAEQRIGCLSALQDMNIEIYGEPQTTWLELICAYDGRLLSNFKFKAIYKDSELSRIYNQSKIGLNVQIDHARDCGLSFRAFDIMACQALLMTPALSKAPLESLGFKDGEDFISFATPEDLRQKCEYFLAHTDQREPIIQSAFLKLQAAHTLRHRLATVFSKANLPIVSQHFLALSDNDISDQLYNTKIWFLDHFDKERKIGRDFDPQASFNIDNNLHADELAIQFNSFRLRIPVNSIPIPKWLKPLVKQFLKQSVRTIGRLGQITNRPVSLIKLPDQKNVFVNTRSIEETLK